MRYAIFSDIHGNLPAWRKVLEDMRALEADVLFCLGDIVGYGPKPQEVLDSIRAETDYFVLGNHDAAAAGILDPSIFNEEAHAIVLWTRDHLNQESLEFLRNLPLELATDDLLFVHAEVSEPGRFDYIVDATIAEANFAAKQHFATFIGHTHHPLIFEQTPDGVVNTYPDEDLNLDPRCRYIINVGSAGEPRNPDDIRARYLIYDDDTKKVYFRRVDFDPEVYRRDLASTSLTHTPYFLQALDHKATVEAATLQAMDVPARSVTEAITMQRKLAFPAQGNISTKTKPQPLRSSQKSSAKPTMVVLGVLLICLGAAYWALTNRSKTPADTSADSPISPPTDVFGQQPSPTRPVRPVAADTIPAEKADSKQPLPPPVRPASAETVPTKMVHRKEALPAADVHKSGASPSPGRGVVTESGMAEMKLLYAVNDGQFDFDAPYTTDNSANISPDSFDRVGYFVELDDDWVWVSMDRFQDDPKLLGVPKTNSRIVENGTIVKNLRIESNREDLNALNRPNLTGVIEFWSSNFLPAGQGDFGSSDMHFDWKDSGGTTDHGYGSFQIFAFHDDRQKKATCLFGITRQGSAGIGNQENYKPFDHLDWISTDWTFPQYPKGPKYNKRNLEIWVGRSK